MKKIIIDIGLPLGMGLIVLLIILIPQFSPDQPQQTGTFGASAGSSITDSCVDHDSIQMHYHADLNITLYGDIVTIPANIGINDTCMRPIHTHDNSGHIHFELPKNYGKIAPTLGDFFTIWGFEFNSSTLLNHTGIVSLVINGEIIDLIQNDPERYKIADQDVIAIKLSK